MLINISDLVSEFKLHINGILHIQTNHKVLNNIYDSITEIVSKDSIAWIESNDREDFIKNCEINVIYEKISSLMTVDSILNKYNKNPNDYNFFNLYMCDKDQSLNILKGCINYLKSVNYIYTKVYTKSWPCPNDSCPLINDINKFLFENGFELIKYAIIEDGSGDAFYIRQPLYSTPYSSQLEQDKWVVHEILKNRRNGFFVEFGGHDGVTFSNTRYMENALGFQGICVEPNPKQYQMMLINRKCICSNELISSETGKTCEFVINGEYSGILDDNSGGNINACVVDKSVIKLTTISLYDLLQKYNAPNVIDYLSIDVEGHEYEILKTFRFDKYIFKCITIEHNEPHHGSKMRNDIRTLLESNGYKFVKGNDDIHRWGHGSIDDFYIYKI